MLRARYVDSAVRSMRSVHPHEIVGILGTHTRYGEVEQVICQRTQRIRLVLTASAGLYSQLLCWPILVWCGGQIATDTRA